MPLTTFARGERCPLWTLQVRAWGLPKSLHVPCLQSPIASGIAGGHGQFDLKELHRLPFYLTNSNLESSIVFGEAKSDPHVGWGDRIQLERGMVIRNRASAQPSLYRDRKSTRLNSSHANISYAVFCLK